MSDYIDKQRAEFLADYAARTRGETLFALNKAAAAAGLDADHPYVVSQVAQATGFTEQMVVTMSQDAKPWYDRLSNIDAIKDREYDLDDLWLIDGVIPRGVVTVFAGKSKAGKSRLAMEAARALATGEPFLGEHDVVAEGTPVVFFCGDDSDTALGSLFKSWAERYGIDKGVTVVMNPELDLLGPTSLREVRALLEHHKNEGGVAPLVVFDSLYNFTPTMDDNDRAPVKKVMGDLKRVAEDGLAAGVLIIDHSAKAGSADAGADAVLGSQAKGGMARSGVNVEAVRTAERDGREVLVTKLVRWGNSGRGWNVQYDHHAPTFTWTRTEDPADDLADKAADLLAGAVGKSMLLKDVGDALGHSDTNRKDNPVRRALEADARFVVEQSAARQPWTVTLVPEAAPNIA